MQVSQFCDDMLRVAFYEATDLVLKSIYARQGEWGSSLLSPDALTEFHRDEALCFINHSTFRRLTVPLPIADAAAAGPT